MPALFNLPKQVPLSSGGSLLPGSKLYFYRTATTTPQNTYQDILLATPHANPVVADSAGVFAPIYLDPSLPHYRVKLTTSADVQVYQIDDVPSNQNTAQTFRLKSTSPSIIFEETDALSANKKWKIGVNGASMTFALLDDAETTETSIFTLNRSGSVGILTFLPALLGTINYKGKEVGTYQSGNFTATFTGFSSAQSAQCTYRKIGQPDGTSLVCLTVPSFTATSNAATFTISNIPSGLAPNTGCYQPIFVVNSGTAAAGVAIITAGAPTVLTFGLGATAAGFTAAGSKGIAGTDYINIFWTAIS
jgi:hypothetical protein